MSLKMFTSHFIKTLLVKKTPEDVFVFRLIYWFNQSSAYDLKSRRAVAVMHSGQ